MEQDITLTVYVVNYNYSKYIKQCLTSLVEQTDQNFELIIIDNGSSDDSLNKISEVYPNLDVERLDNLPLTKVANFALEKSRSDYIVRLDADDWWEPTYVERMKQKILLKPDCAAYFPNYEEVDESGKTQRIVKRYDFDSDVSLLDIPAHGACTIFKKSVLIDVEGYDESLDRQDGFDIWLKIISKYSVSNVHDVLFYYRRHGNNLTSNFKMLMKTRSGILHKHAVNKGYRESDITFVIPIRYSNDFYGKLSQESVQGKKILTRLVEKIAKIHENPKIILTTEDENCSHLLDEHVRSIVKIHLRDDGSTLHHHFPTIASFSKEVYKEECKYLCMLSLEYPLLEDFYILSAISAVYVFNAHSVDSVCTEDGVLLSHDGNSLKPIYNNEVVRFERKTIYKKCGGITVIKCEHLDEFDGICTNRNSHIIVDNISALRVDSYGMLNLVKNNV